MSKEDQLVAVFCPHCGKNMYRYAMTLFNRNVGAPSKIDYDWRCPVCVYTYPEFWLKDERVNHFPYLIFGYGSDKKEIIRITKLVEANKEDIKKSGLEFYDWFKINKDKSLKTLPIPKEVREVIDDLHLKDEDTITIGFETKTVKEWDEQLTNQQNQRTCVQVEGGESNIEADTSSALEGTQGNTIRKGKLSPSADNSNSSMPTNEKKEELPGGMKDQTSSPPGNL